MHVNSHEFSIARRPIRTNCTTGVRTYFCKSTECPESWSSIAAAIAQVGFLSRRRQSKLCTSSAHFLVIRSRIYGHQVAMIPLRSWRFFVVPQTRFFLLAFSTTLHLCMKASKSKETRKTTGTMIWSKKPKKATMWQNDSRKILQGEPTQQSTNKCASTKHILTTTTTTTIADPKE